MSDSKSAENAGAPGNKAANKNQSTGKDPAADKEQQSAQPERKPTKFKVSLVPRAPRVAYSTHDKTCGQIFIPKAPRFSVLTKKQLDFVKSHFEKEKDLQLSPEHLQVSPAN